MQDQHIRRHGSLLQLHLASHSETTGNPARSVHADRGVGQRLLHGLRQPPRPGLLGGLQPLLGGQPEHGPTAGTSGSKNNGDHQSRPRPPPEEAQGLRGGRARRVHPERRPSAGSSRFRDAAARQSRELRERQ